MLAVPAASAHERTVANLLIQAGRYHTRGMRCYYFAGPLLFWLFGPLFLPLYLLCGGVSADNRFERAADRYAQTGNGWWPWSRAAQA